ncbi:MAG: hypothetical protein ACLGGX_00855 [Bdellovibrionia bacterium]
MAMGLSFVSIYINDFDSLGAAYAEANKLSQMGHEVLEIIPNAVGAVIVAGAHQEISDRNWFLSISPQVLTAVRGLNNRIELNNNLHVLESDSLFSLVTEVIKNLKLGTEIIELRPARAGTKHIALLTGEGMVASSDAKVKLTTIADLDSRFVQGFF